MARLSDQEKAQLLAAADKKTPRPPVTPVLPIEAFLEFVTFASTLQSPPKPVRFVGNQWKL